LRTGIGFAVPINLAREVADKLIADGKFTRSWLGIGIRGLHEDEDYRDLMQGLRDGVIVTGILEAGPAHHSDLRPGDVITSVDGKSVATATQLRSEVRSKTAPITLEVVRLDTQQRTNSLKIKIKPQPWPGRATEVAAKQREPRSAEELKELGFKVQSLNAELAKKYDLDESEGLVVTEVERGSVAESRIRPGDLVSAVNHKPVKNLEEFRSAVKAADLKKGVLIDLTSGGTKRFEFLKVPAE
jgi:serine protease Do